VISLTAMDPRPSRALTRSVSAATADPQPSGPQRSGGWRAERSCCCARNGRSPGEEDREQAIAGARPGSAATASWREIRQSKARLDAWHQRSPPRRAPGSEARSGDATSPHQRSLRCISAPSRYPERTRSAGHVRAGDNGDRAHVCAAEGAPSEMRLESTMAPSVCGERDLVRTPAIQRT